MSDKERKQTIVTWSIIFAIAFAFLAWAITLNQLIGTREMKWEFSIVPDIPGESSYSTHNPTRPREFSPGVIPVPPQPQHVMRPGPKDQPLEAPFK